MELVVDFVELALDIGVGWFWCALVLALKSVLTLVLGL